MKMNLINTGLKNFSYCFVRSNNYLKKTGGNVLKFSEFISSDEYNQIKEYSHLSF